MKRSNKKKNLIGKVFGRLTVIAEAKPIIYADGRERAAWECECNCGNKIHKTVDGNSLKQGTTQSCGCLPVENGLNNRKFDPKISSARTTYSRYKDGNITFEQFLEISQKNCYYCNKEPSNKHNANTKLHGNSDYAINNGNFIYNGLDRIDSSRPHDLDNVVPCCVICNIAKRTLSMKDFINSIKKIKINFIKNGYIK